MGIIVGAGPMLGNPLSADDAQIVSTPPSRPEDSKHDRDEQYGTGCQPPRVHGVIVSDR
jgi:hypothetical protein